MTTHSELKERLVARGAQPVNVSFPDGWVEILAKLDEDLAALFPDYTVIQVKVKFGGLRYYYGAAGVDRNIGVEMNVLVRAAEVTASKTCETCGAPGVARQDYWTLCDEHSEGREAVREIN